MKYCLKEALFFLIFDIAFGVEQMHIKIMAGNSVKTKKTQIAYAEIIALVTYSLGQDNTLNTEHH